ncbi:hypothetical protein JTB14_014249 [Gonioctena quinquepunctata]|nr:hypothetical protein JTB14_014249 [Gonioctena quinquepunctata]
MRESAIIMQKYIRRFIAIRRAEERRKAAITIRRFIKGFITRNGEPTAENKKFIKLAKVHWLNRLAKSLPKHILLRKMWPPCPIVCNEASAHLEIMYGAHLSRVYRLNLTPEMRRQFELKVLAEKILKGKKNNYEESIPNKFLTDRVPETSYALKEMYVSQLNGDKEVYATKVIKYDRHGYKPRERIMIISQKHLHLLECKSSLKQKHCLPLKELSFTVTPGKDKLLLVQIPEDLIKKDKGDLILEVPNIIEAVTMIIDTTKDKSLLRIIDKSHIEHNMKGKQGTIDIQKGDISKIHKDKNGHLLIVVSP